MGQQDKSWLKASDVFSRVQAAVFTPELALTASRFWVLKRGKCV